MIERERDSVIILKKQLFEYNLGSVPSPLGVHVGVLNSSVNWSCIHTRPNDEDNNCTTGAPVAKMGCGETQNYLSR